MQVYSFIVVLLAFLLSWNSSQAKTQAKTEVLKPKVIYLLSTPRSGAMVFSRMMYVRGDFEIINEPGVQTFYFLHEPGFPSSITSYEEVKNKIAQKIVTCQNIFIKEMGYAAYDYLLQDPAFLQEQNYYIVFLIRNPHHALISNYKKLRRGIVSNVLHDVMSYKKLYELFEKFKKSGINQPSIILSEELVANSHKIVSQFCQRVEIPFKEESLSWQKLDENFSFEHEWNWYHDKATQTANRWFDKAIESTGFTPEYLSNYAVDALGQPTFEEIENLEHRVFYKKISDDNLPFYKLFLEAYERDLLVQKLGIA